MRPHRLGERRRIDAGAVILAFFVVALTAWVTLMVVGHFAGGLAGMLA